MHYVCKPNVYDIWTKLKLKSLSMISRKENYVFELILQAKSLMCQVGIWHFTTQCRNTILVIQELVPFGFNAPFNGKHNVFEEIDMDDAQCLK